MSTNYSIVKESEKELTKHFFIFYKHVYKSWKKLDDLMSSKKKIEDYDLEEFLKLEHRSNQYEAELLDECIWIISSNQPMERHLRFIVSIIYSISDLERMADYVINNAKFINTHQLDRKIITIISNSIHANLLTMDKIVSELKNQENITKHWITTYRKVVTIQKEFKDLYTKLIKQISAVLYEQTNISDISAVLNGSLLVLKNNERNIDHAINLVENFIYIRNSDFFHNKKSKQDPELYQPKLENALGIVTAGTPPKNKKSHHQK